MNIIDSFPYVLAVLLGIVLYIQLVNRQLVVRIARPAFFTAFLGTLAWSVYISYLQYQAFNSGVLGTTLRTADGISWFFSYSRLHYWNTYLVSLVASFILIFIAQYFHKKRGEVFFEHEELYIAALGIFAVGYPAIFAYVLLMLLLPAIGSVLFLKKGERMPLYYFWMPIAIILILTVQLWGIHEPWWNSFRF